MNNKLEIWNTYFRSSFVLKVPNVECKFPLKYVWGLNKLVKPLRIANKNKCFP